MAPHGSGAFVTKMNRLLLIVGLVLATRPLSAREAKWTRLEAGNFTIISAVSEEETRGWATEFEQFHRGLQRVLRINEAALQPVTVVLFKSQGDMRPYKPLEKGKPAEIDGMFFRGPLGNFIEAAVDSEDGETRRLIFHEGVHWMTNVTDTPVPLWLDEGLAEVFSTFSIDKDLYNYGNVLAGHVLLLDREGMMPLRKLLEIQRGSLLYNEGERTSIFYAESWAFVHYLLFSGKLEERSKFNELVRSLRGRSDPDTVFRKVFGFDCSEMDARLKDYLRHGDYSIVRMKFDRSAVERSFGVRRATRAEVDLAQCSLLSAAKRPADALPRLREVTRAMPDDPAAWVAQGFAAYQTEDYDETDTCFRRAAALGSRNYFVYSFLGDAALGIHPGRITPSMAGDARLALDYFERELELSPRDQHAYDNLAGNVYNLDPITPLDERTLENGALLFPDDPMIRVGMAVAGLRQGHRDAATGVLQGIAADPAPSSRDASGLARFILGDRARIESFERMNDLWQRQDFDGVISLAGEMLKTPLSGADRESVVRSLDRARVASKVDRAVHLCNSGRLAEAKALLLEADAAATDAQMKAQIGVLLERIATARPRPRE